MPLYMRAVHPVNVGRSFPNSVDENGEENLSQKSRKVLVDSQEEAVNRVLSNIIRQLGSLGIHANDIIETLEAETDIIQHRTQSLVRRIAEISLKVEQADNDVSTTSSGHLHSLLNPGEEDPKSLLPLLSESSEWRSTFENDAGLFTPSSRPRAIVAMYGRCEVMPRLDKLQEFRTDQLSCVKQYSDPDMFFVIWKTGMLEAAKQSRLQRKESRVKRKKSKTGDDKGIRNEVKINKIVTKADEIREREVKKGNLTPTKKSKLRSQGSLTIPPADYPEGDHPPEGKPGGRHVTILAPNDPTINPAGMMSTHSDKENGFPRNSLLIPPPPRELLDDPSDFGPHSDTYVDFPADFSPDGFPTPPPADVLGLISAGVNQEAKPRFEFPAQTAIAPTPPVPPPPPPLPPPPPPPPFPGGSITSINTYDSNNSDDEHESSAASDGKSAFLKQIQTGKSLKKVTVIQTKPLDERSDLLKQIRDGKQLKKVAVPDQKRIGQVRDMNNVADVLASVMDQRFGKVHGSDDSSSDDDHESWFEENQFD